EFALEAALPLARNGVKAYLFESLRPTPVLSYAVRKLRAIAGIVVTASHNPKIYNGYKVYWEDGAQCPPDQADEILAKIESRESWLGLEPMPVEEAKKSGLLQFISEEIDKPYVGQVLGLALYPELDRTQGKNLRIVYTPLHGSGNIPVRRVLTELGFTSLTVVPEQELPDAEFPTVPSPNPEDPATFSLAVRLAAETGATVIVATDPDCDRVGVAVPDGEGAFKYLTGNQIGCLLLHYILSAKKAAGTLPGNGAAVKSIVTTGLADAICARYGVAIYETLTGFKYIGEKIQQFADTGSHTFLFGFEESYGYLSSTFVRDKDGVSVWRVTADDDSYVMKCFDRPEYRREIANYQLLNSLGVPTLKMIAYTDCSLVMEDIERSDYRLGTPEDMNDPDTAEKIALWYKTLHENGRDYVNTYDFIDEYDSLTLDNMRFIQEKTGTNGLPVWQVIEKHLDKIRSAVIELPRTLVYTDFYYTNLAVARDGLSALVFDYNFLYKSYVYSDIRNVCWSLGSEEAKAAFLSTYGAFDEREIIIDAVACELSSLVIACQRKVFPNWAKDSVEKVKNGRLLAAVERLLEVIGL
ncbi:MAG: phosphotransferase, partial [Eubacteriaceae bacterium]|nr:phosphotransferase [Eubacteriaceae bacterium]